MLIRKFNSAYPEINSISKYNYGVVNDNIDRAVEKIEKNYISRGMQSR